MAGARVQARWMKALGAAGALAVLVGAVMLAAPLLGDRPGVAPGPPPAERLIPIDGASLSDDRRFVRLEFVGGPPFSIFDPCSDDYGAWTRVADGELELAVHHIEPGWRLQLGPTFCHMIGYERELVVELQQPYEGRTARDIHSGRTFLVARPEGLYEIQLAAAWRLHWDRDMPSPGAPNGQWSRTYLRVAEMGSSGLPGRLDLYQAFGAPAQVYTEGVQSTVTVNGSPATLYRRAETGALWLLWRVGADGLALVANEQDFTVAELIALAASAD